MNSMRIVKLTAENIKRLQAVTITPEGSVVEITGRNGQGKTSVLDAITMALAGGNAIPQQPIRKGEKKAQVIVDLGEIVVTRHWTGESKSYLKIEGKDGKPVSSPQQLLDSLAGQLTFDPLRFVQMKPADQLDTLCRLAGIDRQANERQRKHLYDERTKVNRHVKELKAIIAQQPKLDPNLPDKPVDVAELMAELKEVQQWNQQCERASRKRDDTEQSIDRTQRSIDRLTNEIASLQAQLAEERQTLDDLVEYRESLELPKPRDTESIERQIADAARTNEAIRAAQERQKMARELRNQEAMAEELTKNLDRLQRDELAAIEAAKLPVEGLGLGDQGVMLNGLPFEQASAAEQLRTSVAMAIAMNPRLRVMLIRDGSLLDNESMEILRQMAEDADAQVWIERVSDGQGVGIVIEDGQVASPVVA